MKSCPDYEKIIKYKNMHCTNNEIASMLNVSVSLVEKSWQLNKFRLDIKSKVSPKEYNKIVNLNFKALYLKRELKDLDKIINILSIIPEEATLNDIKEKIIEYSERSNNTDINIKMIENIKTKINQEEIKLSELKKERDCWKLKTNDIYNKILNDNKVSDKSKFEITQHIGFALNEQVWIITSDITTLDYLKLYTKGYIKRAPLSLKNACNVEYMITDIEKYIEYMYNHNLQGKKLNLEKCNDIITFKQCMDANKQLTKIDNDIKKHNSVLEQLMINLQIKESKGTSSSINKDVKEILCRKCMMDFIDDGYIVDMNYNIRGNVVDVIGVNLETLKTVIIVCMINKEDYYNNLEKYSYMLQCNEFYILTNSEDLYYEIEKQPQIGCICYSQNSSYKIMKQAENKSSITNSEELLKNIFKNLWKKAYRIN